MVSLNQITERDKYALILCGNELRYLDYCNEFQKYLEDEVKIGSLNIHRVLCAYKNHGDVLTESSNFIKQVSSEDAVNLIIFYSGHGSNHGMSVNGKSLNYRDLAGAIQSCKDTSFS